MRLTIGVKILASFFSILLLVIGAEAYSLARNQKALQEAVGHGSVFLVEDELARVDKDIFLKIEDIRRFSAHSFLQKELIRSNEAFEKLGKGNGYIAQKDAQWRSAPEDVVTPFMRDLISNELSDMFREEFLLFWQRNYGYPVYGEAFIANKYGANVAQTGKTSDYYQADEEWWQKAREQGFFVGALEYDESAKAWTMPLGVRVNDADGNFLGVIKAIPLAREVMREVEITSKKYQTTEFRLIDSGGRMIYFSKDFQMLEDVSGKDFFQKARGESGFFVAKEAQRESLFAYARSRGFRDFKGLGWILVMSHDTKEVFASIRQHQRTLGVIAVSFFLIGSFFVIWFARTISQPIKKLTEGAKYIAKGNLDIAIDVRTNDEIEELASSFNEMAEELRESYRDLEGKVKERTRQLEERIRELDQTAKLLVRRDFELLQANEMLREVDEAKSRFVSIAAHQLRTPLSSIMWTMRMLLSGDFGKLRKDQDDVIRKADNMLDRLVALVGDLLNVARIESGQTMYTFSPFSVEEVCKKVLEEQLLAAKSHGIVLNLALPSVSLPLVLGDRESIATALQNIVENAITYTPKGSVNIKAEELSAGKGIRVSVEDTGIGIPEFQKNLIGQKFFRADNVIRKQIPGTGLGLYIVTKILERHASMLEVQSEEGRGSTFSFALSLAEKQPNTPP